MNEFQTNINALPPSLLNVQQQTSSTYFTMMVFDCRDFFFLFLLLSTIEKPLPILHSGFCTCHYQCKFQLSHPYKLLQKRLDITILNGKLVIIAVVLSGHVHVNVPLFCEWSAILFELHHIHSNRQKNAIISIIHTEGSKGIYHNSNIQSSCWRRLSVS